MAISNFKEFIGNQTLKYKALLLLFSLVAVKGIFIFPFALIGGVWGVLLGITMTAVMYLLLFIAVYFLRNISWEYKLTKVKWYRVILYMLPALALYSLLLLAVFPGIVPYDSMYIWEMTITNKFTNLHPITYTLYVDALNSIINSPWFIIAVQITYTAFAFAMIAYTFETMGLKRVWCWIITAILSLYPVNAVTTITMLKDVNYMMSLVLMSVLIMKTVVTGKMSWGNIIPLFFVSLFALFSRHNALLTVSVYYIVFVLFYVIGKNRKSVMKAAALALAMLAVFFSTNKVIESVLGGNYWKRSSLLDMVMMPSAQLAFSVNENWYELSDEQLAAAEKYLDLGYIAETVQTRSNWKFSHIYSFTLKYGEIKNDIKGFAKFYFDFLGAYPADMILAYQQMTGIAWAIPNYGYTLAWNTGVAPYPLDMGINPQPLLPKLGEIVNRQPTVFFWHRPAIWLILSILLFFTFSKRHGFAMIAVASPMLANAFGYFIGTPAQNVRYLYCNFTIFLILAVFAFMKKEETRKRDLLPEI